MHNLQMYESLRDMLEREVTEIEKKGTLDAQSLDHLYKLMATLKNTDKCIEREEGASYGRNYDIRGSYGNSYGMRMMPDMSYDRDRYGRYAESRDNFRDSSYRMRSYDGQEGRTKMMDKLNMLMNEATNENERQAIMDCMNKI